MGDGASLLKDWTAPRELTGALPRETRMSRHGIGAAGFAVVLLLTTIAIVAWVCNGKVQEMAQRDRLRREGRDAPGEVYSLRHVTGGPYIVRYRFRANGIALHGYSQAPRHIWETLRETGYLSVRFVPSNPAINHPAAWEVSALPGWGAFVVPAIPAALGVFILLQLRQARRLVTEGVATAGVVTSCYRGGRGSWWVDYDFRTVDGTTATGSHNVRLEVGAIICILYLPQVPSRNRPYLESWYEVVG
jgi:hypothetical protein